MTAVAHGTPGGAVVGEFGWPAVGTPPRRPGSVRRTSSLELLPPATPDGPLVMRGRARDLLTGDDGSATVVAHGLLSLTIGPDLRVASLSTHPDGDRAATLAGRRSQAGFRTAVDATLPDHAAAGSPLHLLLDEVPVGLIISGYAARPVKTGGRWRHPRIDVCVGWARDSAAGRAVLAGAAPPRLAAPVAPSLLTDDALAWHTVGDLPPGGRCRRRRLDVAVEGGDIVVEGMFRDTYVEEDGPERVLHEYGVRAVVDTAHGRVRAVDLRPRALPHGECPAAVPSAQRVVGVRADRLRDVVSIELFGPSSCTHLNDLLRALADVPALARYLPVAAPALDRSAG